MLVPRDPDHGWRALLKEDASFLVRSFSAREFCLWLFIPMFLLTGMVPVAAQFLGKGDLKAEDMTSFLSVVWTSLTHYGAPGGAYCAFAYLLTFWLGSFQLRAGYIGLVGLVFVVHPCPTAKTILNWTYAVSPIALAIVSPRVSVKEFIEKHNDFFTSIYIGKAS